MNTRHLLPLLSLSLLPSLALAHEGDHSHLGLLSGFLHPFTGIDHLLAMLAIGIWAALQVRTLKFAIPASFLGALLIGFLMGTAGFNLPMVESGISLSVLLLGVLIASTLKLPALACLGLAAGFAVFHGYAHGVEASGSLWGFAVGFLGSSLILHLGGGLLATRIQQIPQITRVLGIAIAASGAALML